MINTTVPLQYNHSATGTCDTASAYVNNDSALLELLRAMVGVKDNNSLVKWTKTVRDTQNEPARPPVDWVNLGYNKFYKGED